VEEAVVMVAAILVGLSAMASRLRKGRGLRRTIRMEVTTGTEGPICTAILIGMTIHTTAITTISWFQSVENLTVTGRIDDPTLNALQIR
jgi:hypothetical protein